MAETNTQDGTGAQGAVIGLGTTEAETLVLSGGYFIEERGDASDGALIRTSGTGEASGVFTGEAGAYTLAVTWFNESDGVASFSVLVNGVAEDTWQGVGGTNDRGTPELREITLDLQPGDVITLQGVETGGELGRFDKIELTPADPGENAAPELVDPLADQGAVEGEVVSFTLPGDAFVDPDGDDLTYTATLADGSALPDWLSFDEASLSFTGTPGAGDAGLLQIEVTATDPSGARQSDIFELDVRAATGPLPDAEIGLGTTEAETLDLQGDYFIETRDDASDGALIRTRGEGDASGVFTGPAGTYTLAVTWFNESDGVGRFAVEVNGVTIDEWQGVGGTDDRGTPELREITLDLQPGDVLSLAGTKIDGENGRFDKIELTPAGPGENAAPVAVNEPVTVLDEGSSITLDVLANDTDANGDDLSITQISGMDVSVGQTVTGTAASITLNPDNTLTITAPVGGFIGSSGFSYTVSDGELTDTGFFTVTVNPVAEQADITFGTQAITLLSDDTVGGVEIDSGFDPAISGDGQVVVFTYRDPDAVGLSLSVFARDIATGDTRLVSQSEDGAAANGISLDSDISTDGRFVVFQSSGNNLVSDDANGVPDVFRRDLQTGEVIQVSIADDGAEPNEARFNGKTSDDGRYVVFQTSDSDIVPDDTNGASDIFVRDLDAGTVARVSVSSDGTEGNERSFDPDISDDGRFVVFDSFASNLVPGDTNNRLDVFLKDTVTGELTRLSQNSDGMGGDEDSFNAAISADGRFVTFESIADNLVAGDTNGQRDVFVYELATGELTLASVAEDGRQSNDDSFNAAVSGDGRYVAFTNVSSNLFDDASGVYWQVLLKDLETGELTRLSSTLDGSEGIGTSDGAAISADGRFVAFNSGANNLVAGDTDSFGDIFLVDLQDPFSGPADRSIALPIRVEAQEGESVESVTLSGLPAGSVLSAGVSNGDGTAWTSDTGALDGLRLTVPEDYSGSFDLIVTAVTRDGSATTSTTATQAVTVTPADAGENAAPDLIDPLADQGAVEGVEVSFVLHGDAFVDPDGDDLTYTAQLADGSALPDWLDFDGASLSFTGTPGAGDAGLLQIEVTATDPSGASRSDVFELDVRAASGPLPDAEIGVGETEAETLDLTGDYFVETRDDASDGALIRTRGEGDASGVFTGPAGTYTLAVTWFDEDDGVGLFAVEVNGVTIDEWQGVGGTDDRGTPELREITLDLQPGDVITLAGTKIDGENGRFDKFELTPAEPEENVAPVATDDAATVDEGSSITLDVLANDTDANDDDLSITQINGIDISVGQTVTGTAASITLNADNTLTVAAPKGGVVGETDFSYTVSDGELTDTGFFTVTVNPVAEEADITFGTQAITRISTSAEGEEVRGASSDSVFSPDGAQLVFTSAARTLSSDFIESSLQVFAKNLETGAITLISADASGVAGNLNSEAPDVSPDGTKVVFDSDANNLVPDDTNNRSDIFVKDLETGAIARVSTDSTGAEANGFSYDPVFSADGKKVLFLSEASNLVPDDTNSRTDIFLKDLETGEISRISTDSAGAERNASSIDPVFSPDETQVAFSSFADFVGGPRLAAPEIFVKHLESGTISRVSTTATGQPANGASFSPVFSPDGSKIAFYSLASNLVPGDTNGVLDLFIKDLETGEITWVTEDSRGAQPAFLPPPPAFSPDGTKIAFSSEASNLVANDTDSVSDIFVKDLETGEIRRVSMDAFGNEGNRFSIEPTFAPDGMTLAFSSAASNLVPEDTNGSQDIFLVDLTGPFNGSSDRSIALPIRVEAQEGESVESVTLSGLPAGSVLSAGMSNSDGTEWMFDTGALDGLRLTVPQDYSGSFDLIVTAVTRDGSATTSTSATQTVTVTPADPGENAAPELVDPLADQGAVEGLEVSFTLPGDAFVDPDGDDLTYTATLADGSALPDWLSFDEASLSFTGTPGAGDAGLLQIEVTATDPSGASRSDVFELDVRAASGPLPDAEIGLGTTEAETLVLSGGYFIEERGDASEGALIRTSGTGEASGVFTGPAGTYTLAVTWFNESDGVGRFAVEVNGVTIDEWQGVGGTDDRGTPELREITLDLQPGDVLSLAGTKIDGENGRFDKIELTPAEPGENSTPDLVAPLVDQGAVEGEAVSFTLPGDAFVDPDGDALTYTAQLADGSALPGWLGFDEASLSFTGTPGAGDAGLLQIEVTATDPSGASQSDIFELDVRAATGPLPDAEIGVGTTEAETLELTGGYFIEERGDASEDALIRTSGTGEASGVFTGEAGTYTLAVTWFNESDGVASFSVLVNGVAEDTWQGVGGTNDRGTPELREITLDLQPGDVITLQGVETGGELGRFDKIELTPNSFSLLEDSSFSFDQINGPDESGTHDYAIDAIDPVFSLNGFDEADGTVGAHTASTFDGTGEFFSADFEPTHWDSNDPDWSL